MERMWIVGGGGIGEAIASKARIRSCYVELTGRSVDVRDFNALKSFLKDHSKKEHFTKVVFTAGINELCWVRDLNKSQVMDHMETNLFGFTNLLSALAWYNGETTPRVVAVGSDASRRPMRGSLAYCASKAALDMAVRCAARELGPEGWRINSVNPGMTAPTGMSASIDEQVPEFRGWSKEYSHEYEMAQAVIQRRATPEEVAQVVVDVLFGPDYLNGAIIEVNGGR